MKKIEIFEREEFDGHMMRMTEEKIPKKNATNIKLMENGKEEDKEQDGWSNLERAYK